MLVADPTDRVAQQVDLADQQVVAVAFEQVDGEEPGAAGNERAAVAGNILVPFCRW
jgi:hypothetical protein